MSKDSYSTYYYLLCGFGTGILLAVAIFALLYLAIVPGREPDAARVHGLWEVTSVRNLTTGQLQPHRREYQLFGKTHQMVVLAGAGRPKLTKSLSDMSPEEILSQQPIGAGLYQYEVEDSKISRTNVLRFPPITKGGRSSVRSN